MDGGGGDGGGGGELQACSDEQLLAALLAALRDSHWCAAVGCQPEPVWAVPISLEVRCWRWWGMRGGVICFRRVPRSHAVCFCSRRWTPATSPPDAAGTRRCPGPPTPCPPPPHTHTTHPTTPPPLQVALGEFRDVAVVEAGSSSSSSSGRAAGFAEATTASESASGEEVRVSAGGACGVVPGAGV